MKTDNADFDLNERRLELDFQAVTPLFDSITEHSRLGSPSSEVIDNIYSEASSHTLGLVFKRKLHGYLRIAIASAAMLVILLGGLQMHSTQQNRRRIEVLNQLCIASDAVLEREESPDSSNAALAELLMEMQGFDEQTYFAIN